jgi:hypothetical protein
LAIAAKMLVNIGTKDIRDRYDSVVAAKRKAQEDPTVKFIFFNA